VIYSLSVLVRSRIAAIVVLFAHAVRADDTIEARDLYAQGASAYDGGDYARASNLLAKADALAPNATTLELALNAVLRTEDAVLGEDLALRADARGGSSELADFARRAHARFQPNVGRVRVVCAGEHKCTAKVGSATWFGGEIHAVTPGLVDASFDDRSAQARVSAGAQVDLVEPARVVIAPPPPTPPPVLRAIPEEKPRARGITPAVFWTGFALTAIAGGATIASGLDTRSIHDGFEASPSLDAQSRGKDAELRTNVLLGSTIGLGVATLAIAFFTQWHGRR
jgi:hypothetical protein